MLRIKPIEGGQLVSTPPEMHFLNAIGLIMTYKCQVTCPHCVLHAGPHRKEEVSLKDAFDWINQISDYKNRPIRILSLTGGEPFYDLDKLNKISRFAKKKGLIISAVTNAFWADTYENAEKVLKKLDSIDAIAISTDKYHQNYIPYDNVANAVTAAKRNNIFHYINVCTEDLTDPWYQSLIIELQKIVDPDNIKSVITFPFGRAIEQTDVMRYKTSDKPSKSACSSCSFPVIFPNGKVVACIGPLIDLKQDHPLALGSLRENALRNILDKAELNPILHAIRVWGPGKLVSMAKEAGLSEYLPEKYIENSACSACYSIMSSAEIVKYLSELAIDPKFKKLIEYARLYYLQELQT